MLSRARRSQLVLPLALVLAPAPAAAQSDFLLALAGPPVTVRYTPGALDRADHVQRRFTLLVAETGRKQLNLQLIEVELRDEDQWRRLGLPEPFGLAAITAAGTLALPAWGSDSTVSLWRRLLGGRLPTVGGTPLRGSAEEAASLTAVDLAGQVEAARLVLARLGLTGSEPWVDDLLACALAVSAIQRHEPARWPEARHLFASLAAAPDAATDERLWRLRLAAAAERIGAEAGKQPVRPLFKLARKGRGPLAAATLLERYPWLRAWAAPDR